MKNYYSKEKAKKSGRLSFVLVMMLCTAMIGASCWFAYTQTAKDISIEIDSIIDQNSRIAAAVPETGVVKEKAFQRPTEAVTPKPETQPAPIVNKQETVTETKADVSRETEMPPTAPPVVITFRMPCNGEIIQEFSGGDLVKSATTGVWQTHNGIDIAAAPGDPVFPMEAGIVKSVEEDGLWGICVSIDHQNGVVSKYCGLHPGLKITEGDTVSADEPLGQVGETAEIESALPSHLHFEVRQGDVLIDPVTYISNHG